VNASERGRARPGRRKKRGLREYEHRGEPLLPRHLFVRRMAHNAFIAGAVIVGSLALGAVGYHAFAGLGWIDCILNASMILTGMGPVDPMHTDAAKLFASAYAVFSGVAFLTMVGVLFAPVVHRFLHRFHLGLEEDAEGED
jgi:hypothetical protein